MRGMLHLRVITYRHPWARRQVLCGNSCIVRRVPQTQIQRQPANEGPLILRVDVVLRCLLIRAVWSVPDRYRLRHAVEKCVGGGLVEVVRVVVVRETLAELVTF